MLFSSSSAVGPGAGVDGADCAGAAAAPPPCAAQPGELQLVRRAAVAQIYQREAAVLRVFAAHLPQPERFFIKGEALFKVEYIDIVVHKLKNQNNTPRNHRLFAVCPSILQRAQKYQFLFSKNSLQFGSTLRHEVFTQ